MPDRGRSIPGVLVDLELALCDLHEVLQREFPRFAPIWDRHLQYCRALRQAGEIPDADAAELKRAIEASFTVGMGSFEDLVIARENPVEEKRLNERFDEVRDRVATLARELE